VWTDVHPSTIIRMSWGAVLAGTAVALVAQVLFTLLGLAIGLTITEPLSDQTSWEGIGIGAGVWWLVTSLTSLFLGGWAAARLAGMPLRQDAILHGVVTWALVTLISLYLVIAGTGAVIGGTLNVVQQGIQLTGSVAPQITDTLSGQQGPSPEQIQAEVTEIIQATDSNTAAPEVPTDVTVQDISAALQQFLQQGDEADRQTVINILTERTQMSETEARNTVVEFEQRYQQLGQSAADVAQDATDAVAMSAWWAFFALLAGAIAAVVGSALGVPRDLPASSAVRRE
jgi:hypothetical protein